MYPIEYDWPRIARITLLAIAFVGAGFAVMPAGGLASIASGLALWLGFGVALVLSGLVHREDLVAGRSLLRDLREQLIVEKSSR